MKKLYLLLVLLLSLTLVGCGSSKSKDETSQVNIEDVINNYDSDKTITITNDGKENTFDDIAVVNEVVETPEEYDTFEGLEITEEGNYYLSGDYSYISITAPKGSTVYVFLDGVNINSTEGVAFGSSKQINLHLVLLNDSNNTITNDYEDANAFHVKGNVYISGSGTLNIKSAQKNGLKVSKDLFVYEGVTLNVEGYNHAITARSITIDSATVTAKSLTKDGIQAECDSDVTEYTNEQGYVYLVNADVIVDSYGDGIQADTFVYISGGNIDITTHGEFVAYSAQAMTDYELETDDFKFVKSGSTYKRVAKDEIRSLSSNYYAFKNSVKGIKAGAIEQDTDGDDVDDLTVTSGDYYIYIAHLANVKINSSDDAIHTNYGNVTIENSNLEITTMDDGIHADYDLLISDASIVITSSYEGLEGANITINGENTNIVTISSDDGINAASDYSNSCNITINNGYLRVYASGDGLDANGTLEINGGTVIVEGPGSGNGSLDANQVVFNGGIVFALSTNGMTERMTANQKAFLSQLSNLSSGTVVSIADSSGNVLFQYTLKQSGNQLIFSSPELVQGETYRILAGSSVVATVTVSSNISSSQQGPGGFAPGGRR